MTSATLERPSSTSSLLKFLRPGSILGRSSSVRDGTSHGDTLGQVRDTESRASMRAGSSLEMTQLAKVNLAEKVKRLSPDVQVRILYLYFVCMSVCMCVT